MMQLYTDLEVISVSVENSKIFDQAVSPEAAFSLVGGSVVIVFHEDLTLDHTRKQQGGAMDWLIWQGRKGA